MLKSVFSARLSRNEVMVPSVVLELNKALKSDKTCCEDFDVGLSTNVLGSTYAAAKLTVCNS